MLVWSSSKLPSTAFTVLSCCRVIKEVKLGLFEEQPGRFRTPYPAPPSHKWKSQQFQDLLKKPGSGDGAGCPQHEGRVVLGVGGVSLGRYTEIGRPRKVKPSQLGMEVTRK